MTGRMLILLGILALATPPFVAQVAPATGTIQGTVVREGTNSPIPDVQITLGRGMTLEAAQAVFSSQGRGVNVPIEVVQQALEAQRGGQPSFSAVSDQNGQFTITNVPVGNQNLRAQLEGYFAPETNGTFATVASKAVAVAKDQAVRVQIEMVPGGSFSGRVLDASGRPVSDTAVQLFRGTYQNGVLTFQSIDTRTTDDRGEYRFYRLAPGQYFAAASPRRANPLRPGEVAATGVATYYPNASDRSRAIPIDVRAGNELTGINIQLQTATTVRVSGKVTSSFPLAPAANALGQAREQVAGIAFIPKNRNGSMDERAGTSISARPDGTFEIFNVMPGSYELIAHFPIEPYRGWGPNNPPSSAFGPWAFGRASVEVGNANVENVAVVIRYGNDLNGRLIVDGKPMAANVRISVQADAEVLGSSDIPTAGTFRQIGSFQAPINEDGTFTIPLVPEGHYRFQIAIGGYAPPAGRGARGARGQVDAAAVPSLPLLALPNTAFLADIRQGGVSVFDDGITLGDQAPAPIEVLVNTNAGSVEGTVTAVAPKTASATVVLVPPEHRRQNTALYRTARSDPQGRFIVSNVPPGAYTVFAWESVSDGAFQNAEFLSRFVGRGVNINVTAGNRTNANVNLIPNQASVR